MDRQKFLSDVHSHLEGRIKFVETKVSLIFTFQTVIFAILSLGFKELGKPENCCVVVIYFVALIMYMTLFILITESGFKIIRPMDGKKLFSLHHKLLDDTYIFWPRKGWIANTKTFTDALNIMNVTRMEENYEESIFNLRQLVRAKYDAYKEFFVYFKILIYFEIILSNVLLLIYFLK